MRNASAPASRARLCAARMLKIRTTVWLSSASLSHGAAEREPIELRHEDLGYDDVGLHLARHRERGLAISGKLHAETGLVQKKRLEIAHVRIALDHENDCAVLPVGRPGLSHYPRRERTRRDEQECIKPTPVMSEQEPADPGVPESVEC